MNVHMCQMIHMSHMRQVRHVGHVSDPWVMLNNFCFHVYAQNSLFIGENGNAFFWTAPSTPVPGEIIELVPS